MRDENLTEKDILRFLLIVFDLERTNQLSLLPDKDLADLCHPIKPYQVTKNLFFVLNFYQYYVIPAIKHIFRPRKRNQGTH
ncbi:hypothetical protein [Microcystis aeruginosa]|uniref:hypothetical protein n=1 Tax=Microcystis aeruginosa TaxID=1126 RepID=UPI0009B5A7B4|nr:hypothetical protein [Microcystis aeruginosa]